MKNYGLILKPIVTEGDKAHYVLGGFSKLDGSVINPSRSWLKYLPPPEVQMKNGVETWACTVFGTLNALESLLRFKGYEVNYSDRFVANVAKYRGVLVPGNGADPHEIAEIIRKVSGLLREDRLPFSDDIKSTDDFYGLLERDILSLIKEGQPWYNEWELSHEWTKGTTKQDLQDALSRGPVCASVAAWYQNEKGEYYKPGGSGDNHWTNLADYETSPIIFDSYADGEGDPFLKQLVDGYPFQAAKVYYLTRAQEKISLLKKILDILKQILNIDQKIVQNMEQPIQNTPVPSQEPKEDMQSMVRRVCREEKLDPVMSDRLFRTVACESGFNPVAKNENKINGKVVSTDWGICQFNSHWYIGAGKPIPSVDVAVKDPEFCVRVMCRQFKKGRAKDWICYRKLFPNG